MEIEPTPNQVSVSTDLYKLIQDLAKKENTKMWMLTDFALREMFENQKNLEFVIDGARETKRRVIESRIRKLEIELNDLDELIEQDRA